MAERQILITARMPRLGSGTGLRTYGVTAALARSGPVEVRYVPFGDGAVAPEYQTLPDVTLRPLHASRGAARGAFLVRALVQRVPFSLARGVSPELARSAQDVPATVRIVADGPVVAAALLGLARRRDIVYLAHNLESGGFRGRRGQTSLRRFERSVLRTFSEAWMPTRAEQDGARALAGAEIVTRYVPNVVDVAAIAPLRPAGARRILFVADFTYAPNREALGFLVEHVMPAAWRRDPRLELRVVGRGAGDPRSDPRIEIAGFVPSLADAYGGCDAVVVPLLHGGGSPLKLIEGLAYGLPVVASAHAAGLIELGVAGRDFLTAATAEEFAAAIEQLLSDRARADSVGTAGRELAARCHSIDSLASLLSP